jgi:uncharacterized membrane protein YhaH (DUF805 family)
MTSPSNPYAAPQAAVADVYTSGQPQPVRLWNPGGRMGRSYYIAYTVGGSLLLGLVLGVLSAVLGGDNIMITLLTIVGYVVYMVLYIELTVQRCHDFNSSGWLSLLAIVPLVNLIFWFIPGTQGANRWGAPPTRGPRWAVFLVIGLLVVMIVGILAAIAIPAYSDYTKRARAAQVK